MFDLKLDDGHKIAFASIHTSVPHQSIVWISFQCAMAVCKVLCIS